MSASTVFMRPEYANTGAVLSHELAHVAQLRSGATAPRAQAESAATRVARGQSRDAGGAAAPPLFAREVDAISGADALSDRPLAGYPKLAGALEPGDVLSLEAAMRRRNRIAASALPEPPAGATSVQVPLRALIDPEYLNTPSHDQMLDSLFDVMVADELFAEAGVRALIRNDALRMYVEAHSYFDVDVELRDPDASTREPTQLRFRVGQIEIDTADGLVPLGSLEALGAPSLRECCDAVGAVAAQVAQVAGLVGQAGEAYEKTHQTANDIINDQAEYALNDVLQLRSAASTFLEQLRNAPHQLLPQNQHLSARLTAAADHFAPALLAAGTAARGAQAFFYGKVNTGFFSVDGVPQSAGEIYEQAESDLADDFSNAGAGGKIEYGYRWLYLEVADTAGEIATGGGMGMTAQNSKLYHAGEISYHAWLKNNYVNLGKVAIVAAVTALTAGEGEGFAIGALGAQSASGLALYFNLVKTNAVLAMTQAAVSDVYSSLVAEIASDPGVALAARRSIGGISGILRAGLAGAEYGPASALLPAPEVAAGEGPHVPVADPEAAAPTDVAKAAVKSPDAPPPLGPELEPTPRSGDLSVRERALLAETARKDELTPPEFLAEEAIAEKTPGSSINEPPFVEERVLPNGHRLKRTADGEFYERCSGPPCEFYDRDGELIEEDEMHREIAEMFGEQQGYSEPGDYGVPEGPDAVSRQRNPPSYPREPVGLQPDPIDPEAYQLADSGVLARNLRRAGEPKPGAGFEAHHIVPGSEPEAARVRAVLDENDIPINVAENGVWLIRGTAHPNVELSVPHDFTFADHPEYFEALDDDLLPFEGLTNVREAVLERLGAIKEQLSLGRYPPSITSRSGELVNASLREE